MLTRRHIRVKVMQCIYALTLSKDDSLEKQEKFLNVSIASTYSLYLLVMALFAELRQMARKHATHQSKSYLEDSNKDFPDREKFANNKLLLKISENKKLKEEQKKRKLNNWYLNEEYVKIIYKEITGSDSFTSYMKNEKGSYEEDQALLLELFREVIAPNEKLYDYYEDEHITWVDDIPLVNTFIMKRLKKAEESFNDSYFLPKLLKDKEDMSFANTLLSKTLLNNAALEQEIVGKTPNWDKDRIAEIDAILLKMAICELLYFPSIPERVTINEYLEIAKEYSTPKSSIFINGILDKLVREYKMEGKLKKAGRGLM